MFAYSRKTIEYLKAVDESDDRALRCKYPAMLNTDSLGTLVA
ncbi:unnamed protein product, partial [Rotaria magnacalcarata]